MKWSSLHQLKSRSTQVQVHTHNTDWTTEQQRERMKLRCYRGDVARKIATKNNCTSLTSNVQFYRLPRGLRRFTRTVQMVTEELLEPSPEVTQLASPRFIMSHLRRDDSDKTKKRPHNGSRGSDGFCSPGRLLSQVRRTGMERAPVDVTCCSISDRCRDSGAFSTISVILMCTGDGWRSKQTIKWRHEQAIC